MSLRQRALLAVVLALAFYGLSALVAGGLLLVPVLEWAVLHRITPLVVLFCTLGASLIIWSILPRRIPFRPLHPALDPSAQSGLFAELRALARDVGQLMPADVYLDLSVNASVGQRGRLPGLGGRRFMVLGLPLLAVLRVTELRAVIAHELGHYQGGDTRLAPWVYRVEASIRRTQEHVGGYSGLIHAPFLLFGMLFKRVSRHVSRHQELAADMLAARMVGARPLTNALDESDRAGIAFDPYWRSEVMPVLECGFLPPIADGFASFISRPSISSDVDRAVRERRANPPANLDDRHPLYAERVHALRSAPPGLDPASEPAAISLLRDVPAVEWALVAGLMRRESPCLEPIGWSDVGARVVVARWQHQESEFGSLVQGMFVESLPELIAGAGRLGRLLARSRGADAWLSENDAAEIGLSALEGAVGLAMSRDGWHVESLPGMPVVLSKNRGALDLRDAIGKLASGQFAPTSWRQRCGELGISDLSLAAVDATGPARGR